MTQYVTGAAIRTLREKKHYTQKQLADRLCVSDKTVSKWENGRGFPDIALLEPLAQHLGVSVAELLSGQCVTNHNRAGNMLRTKFYVCPLCGNVIHACGEMVAGSGTVSAAMAGPAVRRHDNRETVEIVLAMSGMRRLQHKLEAI